MNQINPSQKSLSQKSLRRLHKILLLTHRHSLRHPRAWLSGLVLLVILAVCFLPKLQMLLSIDDLIDKDFQTYEDLQDLNHTFKDKNNVFLVLTPKDPHGVISKSVICDLQKWIQDQVEKRGDITRVLSSYGVRRTSTDQNFITFPKLLKFNCFDSMNLESETVSRSLKDIQGSPWGVSLSSKTANDLAVNFFLKDTVEDKRYGAFDTRIVGDIMKSFQADLLGRHPEIRASWVGVGLFQYYLKEGFDFTGVLNIAIAILLLLIFRGLFGTYKSGWIFLLTILVASILIYGGLAASHTPIDVLTNMLSLMLIISSIEDFLFISYLQMREGGHSRRAFRKLLVPGFFTSLTTVIGFGSLYAADLGIIRRFGAWAAGAAALEWTMVFLFLPAFLQIFPRLGIWTQAEKTASLGWFEKLNSMRLPRFVAYVALIVYPVGILGAKHLHVTDAPANVFPKNHQVRKDLRSVEESRGWQTDISLVFADYDRREQNEKVIGEFSRFPNVAGVENPYQIIDYLLKGTNASQARQIKSDWYNTEVAQRLVSWDGQARALLYMKDTDIIEVNRMRAEARRLCPNQECHLAGSLVSYGEFGDRVLGTLLSSLGLSLVLVAVVLLYLMTALGIQKKTLVLLSAMWGPGALLCLFYVLHIPIFYVTSMFASVLVGLAGDNTIQYLFGARDKTLKKGIEQLGGATIQVSLTMIILSVVFFGSYFAPLRILGGLLICGFILALTGDLWLLKGLISGEAEQTSLETK